MLIMRLPLDQQIDAHNDQGHWPPLGQEGTETRYPPKISQEEKNPQNNQYQRGKDGF